MTTLNLLTFQYDPPQSEFSHVATKFAKVPKKKASDRQTDRRFPYYILVRLLSNLIEEGTVQCIVE